MESFTVYISSSLMADFVFRQIREYDVEGLFIGEITSKIVESITDSRLCNRKREINFNIHSVVNCEEKFYDCYGNVDWDRINVIRKNKCQDVIGWYRCRHNTTAQMSVREKAIHKQLIGELAYEHPHLFIFSLFTSFTSDNQALHTKNNLILHQLKGRYEPVSLCITNLGDTSHSDYKTSDVSAICSSDGICNQLLKKFRKDSESAVPDAVTLMENLHTDIWRNLQHVKESLYHTDRNISSLENEIKFLESCMSSQTLPVKKQSTEEEKTVEPSVEKAKDPFQFVHDIKERMKLNIKKSS